MTGLDWKRHKVGALKPCRICGNGALCRDEHDWPCHKTCAEKELDEQTAAAASAYATTAMDMRGTG